MAWKIDGGLALFKFKQGRCRGLLQVLVNVLEVGRLQRDQWALDVETSCCLGFCLVGRSVVGAEQLRRPVARRTQDCLRFYALSRQTGDQITLKQRLV